MQVSTSPRKSFLRGAALGAASVAALAVAVIGLGAEAQAPRLLSPTTSADGTLSFADLVERVSPAVVSVMVEREVERPRGPSDLEQFFRFRFGAPDQGAPDEFEDEGPETMQAQGSGFFIDASGHIVTNNHVVADATAIEVQTADGKTLTATLVGRDELTDLAVLKVDPPKGQAFVQFAEDVNLRVGDFVLAVGNPFGLSGTVTSGIVSAIGGRGRNAQYVDFIQIDAPINRGNSGGPTFDLKGRVVGVNTAIFSTTGGSMGIGFAIPAKVAKDTVAQLIKSGSVTRGWLGVQIQPVTEDIAKGLGIENAEGALVADVFADTPAAKGGLKFQDVILEVNGEKIDDNLDLTRTIARLAPGEKAKLKIIRDKAEKNLTVTLGERNEERLAGNSFDEAPGAGTEDSLSADVGLRLANITPTLRQQFRIPDEVNGALVTAVKRGSAAEEAGLRTGMVILDIDGKTVVSPATVKEVVDDAKDAGKEVVLVRFQAGDAKQFVGLNLKEG